MSVELIHVGFGSYVALNRAMAILSPESAPVKRMIQQARAEGKAIDATYGRKTKSIIVLDNGQVMLSGLNSETIASRWENARSSRQGADE